MKIVDLHCDTIHRLMFEGLKGNLDVNEGAIEGDLDRLEHLYAEGVRSMTLVWNYENEIGFPSQTPGFQSKGLKKFGFEVLEKMETLGMLVDVSHLSDQGFWDIYQHAQKPFIASHSCSRSIQNHPRNLTDAMIRGIAEKGGVIGLNYFGVFLNGTMKSTLDAMVKHAIHILNVGGSEVLALGSDFDGFKGIAEMAEISQIGKLQEALQKHGMSDSQIEKIMYCNSLRVIREILE